MPDKTLKEKVYNFRRLSPRSRLVLCKVTPEGCHEVVSHARSKKNYARIKYKNLPVSLHRISWVYHFGAIPKGLLVCHHCDNPPCVNPAHLFLGTPADNVRDMFNKNRQGNPGLANKGSRNGMSKLTEDDVSYIRSMKGILTLKELAKRFGVIVNHIYLVQAGRCWNHNGGDTRDAEE